MTENAHEYFRRALKEFKAADAWLSSKLETHEDIASSEKSEITQKSNAAQKAAASYMELIENEYSFSDGVTCKVELSPQINKDLKALEALTLQIQKNKRDLRQAKERLNVLNQRLADALKEEDEASKEAERLRCLAELKAEQERKRRRARRMVTATVMAGLLVGLHFWLQSHTRLGFTFSLDGAPLPVDKIPIINLDGNLFTIGGRISLGHHKLSITLQDAEPLRREFWGFYGKKDLGIMALESSKGSLSVSVSPLPATVFIHREGKWLQQGDAPFQVNKLPVGFYSLVVHKGKYEESFSIEIQREKKTEAQIDLKIGNLDLAAEPADAEFELSGNGKSWKGKLPARIEDVPLGNYRLAVERKGWKLYNDVKVSKGVTTTNKTDFPYGSIEVNSDPQGLIASINGVEIGRTPISQYEVKPEQYAVKVTDGENDLAMNLIVTPKAATKHKFIFHYGVLQLSSIPVGATVFRKGKEIGKTPLTLEHAPTEATAIELRLDDYVSTNLFILAQEGQMTSLTVNLISKRYLTAMEEARRALDANQFERARQSVSLALQYHSTDSAALSLQKEITEKPEKLRQQKIISDQIAAKVNAEVLAKFPLLEPEKVIKDCWNTGKSESQFSSLSTIEAAKSNPAAVPAAIATDAMVKSIEVIASPFHMLKGQKGPQLNQGRFNFAYRNNIYRYYGKIAEVDLESEKTKITFAPGGKSKGTYAVSARLSNNSASDASLKAGASVWVSGKLTFLLDKSNLSKWNTLILDEATIYPAETLSPGNKVLNQK
jgi:hypothetical protein